MSILIKQPTESRVYALNFKRLLASGDTLSAVTSLTASPAGQLTLGTPAVDSPKVLFRVEDGVAGTRYTVTALATTTLGDTLEGEGLLEVLDL